MESQLISEFISKTGASPTDAVSCLKTWGWDVKRAITDYNDTIANDLRNDIIHEESCPTSKENCDGKDVVNKRLNLIKSDSIDVVDCRKLSRGISRATDNINLVSRARTEIAMDYHSSCQKNLDQLHSIDSPDYTFILPNIFNYPSPFRNFLEKDLIESSTLSALEQSHRLNWWAEGGTCRKLWPLATTGDGNCLLHAASLGMWGFHDRKLTLRTALYSILSNGKCRDALWRRWRFQQTRCNMKAGFVYSEIEWAKEWDEIVSMSSPEPRQNSQNSKDNYRRRISVDRSTLMGADSFDDSATYESLEEIHILALAHILRRTIIVISDTVLRDLNGEAMAPIPFGGIYLPFEINPNDCNRGPLLLAYDMAHFSALVPMESDCEYPPSLIPLTDHENVLLPIQFCIDPGEDFDWKSYDGSEGNWALTDREHIALLKEYLDIVYVTSTGSPEDEICEDLTDEEFEKKFSESEVIIPHTHSGSTSDESQSGKSKAAKQLQSVAKQFGSIGKSMSKKIKKNIGSITKIGGKNVQKKNTLSSGSSIQSFTCTKILCARLRVRRHEFQEEMIRNYLDCARHRFLEAEKNKEKQSDHDRQQFELLSLQEREKDDITVYCINAGCNNFGTSETSYLCPECFEKQKERESVAFLNSAPRYGTGRSKFYTQADASSHDSIRHMPPVRRLNELDQTLYLSNSTFFNDKLPGFEAVVPSRDSIYRHGYSPTVKLIDDTPDNNSPPGTVSVFSPGNTVAKHVSLEAQPKPLSSATHLEDRQSSGRPLSIPSSRIPTPLAQLQAKPCRTPGCMFYGTSCTSFYCSKCCQTNCELDFCSKFSKCPPQASTVYPTATAAITKTGSKIMSDI